MSSHPDYPRSLRDPAAVAKRRALLAEQKAQPLAEYVTRLRGMGRGEVPDFDPLDGGYRAQVLFLFEKPGPMTSLDRGREKKGSGFISRDNDDPTAEATFRFMQKAGLDRQLTAVWNTVPWWNGTRAIRADELHAGMNALDELLCLMENRRVIMLVGRKAARVRSHLEKRCIPVLQSPHPSPIVRASRPVAWQSIPVQWSEAVPFTRSPR